MKYGQFIGMVADMWSLPHGEFMVAAEVLLDPQHSGREDLSDVLHGNLPVADVDEYGAARVVCLAIAATSNPHYSENWADAAQFLDLSEGKSIRRAMKAGNAVELLVGHGVGPVRVSASIQGDQLQEIWRAVSPAVVKLMRVN